MDAYSASQECEKDAAPGGAGSMDLRRVLAATRKGQWSIHEFDWDAPLQGVGGLSKRELREAGLMIVFTAGLEFQAAEIFRLCAHFVSDKQARQIYELFVIDEIRHAQAELLLAKRYGVGWKDLPFVTRLMFRGLRGMWEPPNRLIHEFTSAQIVLFEIALDSLLIPALKSRIKDPLQDEVFRRIDLDESRHLAMDYWLLERKGRGVDIVSGRPSPADYRRLLPVLPLTPVGFAALSREAKTMQRQINKPEQMEKYWARVKAIRERAPLAASLPTFKRGVKMQRELQRAMMTLAGIKQSEVAAEESSAIS
ncbi:MAG: hypothetical protein AB1405_07945 [Bdellovibrionota bacterium]